MTVTISTTPATAALPKRKKYVPVVGPRLKRLLMVVFGLTAVLGVNSAYLVSISLLEWFTSRSYQNYFFQWMFLVHLVLGLVLILPVVMFGAVHMRNAWNRPNRRAVRAGMALFIVSLLLLVSGVVLTRGHGIAALELKEATSRAVVYWLHVLSPLVVAWLFVLHRLAGRRIKWKIGGAWAAVAAIVALGMTAMHSVSPNTSEKGPIAGEKYFHPSLARTSTGNFIPAEAMMMNDYCLRCHADVHASWAKSVHAISSFNNPPYAFSVRETRKMGFERDGNVHASRFCAGCHDPVPFFSGAFENASFDDPEYDVSKDPLGSAGITCVACHSVVAINDNRGNASFTIEEPTHYPFATSANPFLQWVNNTLVKANPTFHKETFLKPLHKSAEFCGTCHKVHLPEELNHYKWLRGQNSFDSFWLSGVSGYGVQAFYFPPKAQENCNGCHMPTMASFDFASKHRDDSGILKTLDHSFPSANTAIPVLVGMENADEIIAAHEKFNEGVMRVDIFGVREGGTIDGPLTAPLRPELPALRPGGRYLIETVVRTVKMGHDFTQGTADSNEIWLDVTVTSGDRVIGRSGGLRASDREVDPWSHFFNVYMLDRDGKRIDRRNPEDIFIPLYNHQIPPGAAATVQYAMTVPEGLTEPITVDVKLQYRKFDTAYMKLVYGENYARNDLHIMTMARDSVTFAIDGTNTPVENAEFKTAAWERWNDYGIGLLRKGERGSSSGALRQAEEAFKQVEALGRYDGPINLARVYIREGRVQREAPDALSRAAAMKDPAAPEWSLLWFSGVVKKDNGDFDEAITDFEQIMAGNFAQAKDRGFDFSKDYRLLNELGQTLYERAKQERGPQRADARKAILERAVDLFDRTLLIDSENLVAHYNLQLIHADLGHVEKAAHHEAQHAKYKPDDNARDRAIANARRNSPAANHAAEAVVIYDLQRDGAYGLSPRGIAVSER